MNRIFTSPRETRLTIFHEFAPTTLISRILGIFPFKSSTVSGNQVFVTSRAAMIYSILLLGLTSIHLIYSPQMTIEASNFVNNYDKSRNISAEIPQSHLVTRNIRLLIRLLNSIVMSLMGIFSKINAISYIRNTLPKAFATLNSIDNLVRPKLKHRKNNIKSIRILVGISILIGLPGQIYSSIFIYMGESYFIGIYVLVNNLNNLTAVFAEAEFMAMCYLLKSRFAMINQKLLDILKLYDLEKRSYTRITNGTVAEYPTGIHSLSEIESIAALKKDLSVQEKSRSTSELEYLYSKRSISKTIRILRMGHQRLCDALDQVNYMFQVQILVSISGCFLNELFNMYSLFFGGAWKAQKTVDPNAPSNKNTALLTHPLISLSWGIYYAARIGAMAAMASKTIKTAKHSVIHILDIRRINVDLATKEELLHFHDHVTSRKVEFSAAGFFKLDIALISSVVATGSTYLVMMVQFRDYE